MTALGETVVDGFSDVGSTPTGSTILIIRFLCHFKEWRFYIYVYLFLFRLYVGSNPTGLLSFLTVLSPTFTLSSNTFLISSLTFVPFKFDTTTSQFIKDVLNPKAANRIFDARKPIREIQCENIRKTEYILLVIYLMRNLYYFNSHEKEFSQENVHYPTNTNILLGLLKKRIT